jgi:type II secretory pathway pseudopilin PulG
MRAHCGHGSGGFTYLGLLFAVVLAGIALALTAQIAYTVNQRAREAQLLFVGGQIRDAIRRYHEQTPGGVPRSFPRRFEDLLSDARYPTTRRYLRRLYADPMTNKFDWAIERSPDGGIAGVHSTSQDVPFKLAGFAAGFDFDGAKKYSQWIFVYQAPAGDGEAAVPPPDSQAPPGAPTR